MKVKRRGDDQKFIAEVLAIGYECDIALLTVQDETFWEGVQPLEFGPLPRLQVTAASVSHTCIALARVDDFPSCAVDISAA